MPRISTRRHSRAANGAPHQASSTTRNFNFAIGAARTLAGYRSRSAERSMVQTISRNDCLRRGGTCEDVLTARTGSCGRRGDVIAIKFAMASRRSRGDSPWSGLRLRRPPLQPMERDRHFGNIRVTEQIGRIACGWLDCCVLSRLGIIAIRQNQPITSHYECSC